ncbi:MAG TPA: beta-ketoacyl synthase N-terminal-like domain-containing protein [Thermoanaerobaculia bacterium]|nr:beta-ketoacyl synthase N-terminal-like domain-containing protein [Thermoanaerobaculia bacterium]
MDDERELSEMDVDQVAVIGRACRFPKAADVDAFWANLRDGVEGITFFGEEELAAAGVPAETLRRPEYVRAKGVLEDAERFDADFFGFTPREAEVMDPQQRLFLETAWQACEDAGYDPQAYAGKIGVYGGSGFNSYLVWNLLSNPEVLAAAGGLQARLFNDKDFLTTHVSYKLNLRGPSMAVQTACSTSMVAVHLACQSLLEGECDMALAGGVTVGFPQTGGYLFQEGSIYSPDGHCRAFDERAQGTVEGQGAGVVLLKRLADALADGDPIHAVIRGSAVNNDGAGKAGYTAPSIESQTQVVTEALTMARVDPATIGYVEAHGSGTPIGDPIEVASLTRAFRTAGAAEIGFCGLGSVKTSIGHTDTAAGVASLIKVVEALRHGQIPPSLHFEKPNPRLALDESPFYVAAGLRDWPRRGAPRRAGVNSLAIGGTNVHAVLEEAPPLPPASPSRPWQLLVLSARTPAALEAATANLARRLETDPDLDLADVAHTLRVGRRPFRHRRALVCREREEALRALRGEEAGMLLTADAGLDERGAAFLFPGLGDHYTGMAAELYRAEPAFREAIDRCIAVVGPEFLQALFPEGMQPGAGAHPSRRQNDLRRMLADPATAEPGGLLGRTAFAHPAVFAVEYALAELWREWGVKPRAMIGYSLGEYVAACLAGVFSLKEGLAFVAARARLIDALPAGAMLAVPLPLADVEPLVAAEPELSLAADNGPALTVVGGPAAAVEAFAQRLAGRGVACRRLQTAHAFHTRLMEPVVPEFTRLLGEVRLAPPKVPFVSNVTGTWITAEEATDPGYWARHLCRPVRFAQGLETLMAGGQVLIEVGPGQSLGTLARQHPSRPAGQTVAASLPDRRDGVSEQAFLLESLGRVWLAGVAPDWQGLVRGERRRRVSLPAYPFERRRFFVERAAPSVVPAPKTERKGLDDWFYVPVWERSPERAERTASQEGGDWLLFVRDGEPLGAALAARLEAGGGRVTRVLPDDLDPRRPDGTKALFRRLKEEGALPSGIAHLWTLGEPAGDIQDRGFYSLLWIAQALGEQEPRPVHLAVVTSGLHEVTGDETLRPEVATVLGPCRVLPQEIPHLTCSAIDVLPGDDVAARLAAELRAPPGERVEAAVALRGRHRWVQRFRSVQLPVSPTSQTRLRPEGVYLLAGELDEGQTVLAEHLFRAVRARLALLVPPNAPARAKWSEWLAAHDEDDDTSRQIRRLLALETEGCELLVLPADVTQPARAVARAREHFGALHGAVHAAGLAGAGLAQWKTRAMANDVLAPKVQGTQALAAAVGDVDFFVLFGANASATGGFGQVDTCAASSFLDVFAQSRRLRTIDWGFFRWQPVTASDPAFAAQLRMALDGFGIGAREMTEVFDRVLAAPHPQVVVSTQDLAAVTAQLGGLGTPAFAPAAPDAGTVGAAHPRPELAVSYEPPGTEVERAIAAVWEQSFGIDQVGVHDNFFDLAGNSLLAIQIVTRISSELKVNLPMASLLEAPTVAELAARVEADRSVHAAQAAPAETDMERLLREIESLSPEEAEAKLARELAEASL